VSKHPANDAELVDLTGIARMRGVSRQRAQQLSRHPAFPAPLPVEGGQRKVWDRTAVQEFLNAERKPGRPPVSR
jgi:hypothetical protein